ncbi:MAG TPA: radical SAM protein [Blastocatellia bacterium]|nr:radical SAM protein [Blastocatellia bacterium]
MKCLSLHITDICNFSCSFCVWGETLVQSGERIPKAELERFLIENRDQGFEMVNLHGGEPTLRRDLFEILSFIRNLGYPAVSIQTNGWALANPRFARRLIEAGVSLFVVSLHGHTPDIHDTLSGAPGSFARIISGIGQVLDLGGSIRTNTVIMRPNYRFLPQIVECAIESGALHVNLSSLMPTGRASALDGHLMPTYAEIEGNVGAAIEAAKSRGAVATLEGFPRCAVRGYENHCLLREMSEDEQVKCLIRGEVWQNHDSFVEDSCKMKRPECLGCIHTRECGGVYKLYVQAKGWSEFQPVGPQISQVREVA